MNLLINCNFFVILQISICTSSFTDLLKIFELETVCAVVGYWVSGGFKRYTTFAVPREMFLALFVVTTWCVPLKMTRQHVFFQWRSCPILGRCIRHCNLWFLSPFLRLDAKVLYILLTEKCHHFEAVNHMTPRWFWSMRKVRSAIESDNKSDWRENPQNTSILYRFPLQLIYPWWWNHRSPMRFHCRKMPYLSIGLSVHPSRPLHPLYPSYLHLRAICSPYHSSNPYAFPCFLFSLPFASFPSPLPLCPSPRYTRDRQTKTFWHFTLVLSPFRNKFLLSTHHFSAAASVYPFMSFRGLVLDQLLTKVQIPFLCWSWPNFPFLGSRSDEKISIRSSRIRPRRNFGLKHLLVHYDGWNDFARTCSNLACMKTEVTRTCIIQKSR